MKTIDEIRRDNLSKLIAETGSITDLATKLNRGYAQLNQWVNASKDSKTGKPRSIGNNSARRIEEITNKPIGWFDIEHGHNDTIYLPKSGESESISKIVDPLNEMARKKILRIVETLLGTTIELNDELEIGGPTGKTKATSKQRDKISSF